MGMTTRRAPGRALVVGGLALLLGACATAAPAPAPGTAATPARPGPRPAAYESEDFVVTFAQAGDTPATLAARYLGSADRAWMIEDYSGQQAFSPGQEVGIPPRGGWGSPPAGRGPRPGSRRAATRSCRSSPTTTWGNRRRAASSWPRRPS